MFDIVILLNTRRRMICGNPELSYDVLKFHLDNYRKDDYLVTYISVAKYKLLDNLLNTQIENSE